jgi:hypothetical protein
MVTRYQIPTDLAPVDTSYANYMRLASLILIPTESQMVSLDWQWMSQEAKILEIRRLMNLAEVRDQPENSTEAAW